MSTYFVPKSSVCNKIPLFDQYNFSHWRSKAMKVLEFTDFDMLDVINKGPIDVMHQSSSNGASSSKLQGKFIPCYNKEEKRMLNLDVKARISIRNSLPFSVYFLVQNCSTAQQMMTILASAFVKNSSDGEVKCLMAHNVESHAVTSYDSVGILNDDSPHTVDNLKSKRDDTSAYQIKNHVNLSSIDNIEKEDMIHLPHFNLLISNKRKSPLSLELKILKEKLIALENSLFVLKRENTYQCKKILGGDIEGAVSLTKIESKETFYKVECLKEDFKSRFVNSYFINQTLSNTHFSTDSNGITKCVTKLYALDPSLQPSHNEHVLPSTKTLLKFPICKGEVHYVNKILSMFPQCSVSDSEPEDQLKTSTPENSSKDHESHDNIFAQSQESLRTFWLLELPNKMILQKEEIELLLKLEELWFLKLVFHCHFGLKPSIQGVIPKTGLLLSNVMGKLLMSYGKEENQTFFHVFGRVCYISNQRDQRSKIEAKADEGVFLGYSSVSKAYRVFILSRQIVEETIHVTFNENPFLHDRVDHPSSILYELTYSPSDPVPELLSNDDDPIVPNVDQLISSQPIPEDQPIVYEEYDSSNQEVSAHSNTNGISNPRIL
uniref:Retroviral polymerase SH3-like domain-containing protein n=1 Tax=Lactuca sativa TaxID=4236 RepID=A0A9R1VN08_LACSA|nr:hypothetical protein LSAT_V11C500261860 [Lactuca sativa]